FAREDITRACGAGSKRTSNEVRSVSHCTRHGGAEGDRTPDLLTASQALSQLSYSPATPPRARQCICRRDMESSPFLARSERLTRENSGLRGSRFLTLV